MISYYPGDLPPITGNPDDIFLCDPIKEAASEYLQSEAKRRKEIIAQIEKADAITYQLNTGIYIIVSPSFEPDYIYTKYIAKQRVCSKARQGHRSTKHL